MSTKSGEAHSGSWFDYAHVSARSNREPVVWLRFDQPAIYATNDDFCVLMSLHVEVDFSYTLPGPQGFCRFRDVQIELCGRLDLVVNRRDRRFPWARDGRFVLTEHYVNLGKSETDFPYVCFGAMRTGLEAELLSAIPAQVPAQASRAFNASLWIRELPDFTRSYLPGRCAQPALTFAESFCGDETSWAAQQRRCRAFVLGDPESELPVRTWCGRRRNLNRAGVEVRDEFPMCYWNVEADRIEMLPSRLEVVLAEDERDPLPAILDRLADAGDLTDFFGSETFCRNGALERYRLFGTAAGRLERFTVTRR